MAAPRLDKIDFNPIINGTFEFAQRSGGLILQTLSAPQYTLDRWYMNRQTGVAGDGQLAVQISSVVPTQAEAGFPFRTSMFVGVNEVRVNGTNQFHQVGHVIEGNRFATLSKKKLVYQFWTRCNVAGTYSVVFNAPASTFKWLSTYQDAGANVWTKRQVVVDMSSHGGSVALDNSGGLRITHWLSGSAVHQGASSYQWITGTPSIPNSGLPNFIGSLSSSLHITGAMLREVSDEQYTKVLNGELIDLEFTRAGGSYPDELRLCQRYYEVGSHAASDSGNASGVLGGLGRVKFLVEKRSTAPLCSVFGNGSPNQVRNDNNGATEGTIAVGSTGSDGFSPRSTSGLNNDIQYSMTWTADAEL